MRAFVLKDRVAPDQIMLSDVETPVPGPGEG
jgi:hypothetical protein